MVGSPMVSCVEYDRTDLFCYRAELCERNLHDFTRINWSTVESQEFINNWHIEAICEHLEAVTRGDIKKLLINVPPGCSKSLITCVFWFCWEWGPVGNNWTRWFFASYDQRLSTRDSVKCRSLINSPFYQRFWGNRVIWKGDQNQKTYYENDATGYRLATSTGGHGTGEHPDRIIYDDPHKVMGAETETDRENVREWHDLTMQSRGVSRDVKRVIIMQRLHEEDISGHVLATEGDWEHLCLPMYYEPGRMKTTVLGFVDPRSIEGAWEDPVTDPVATLLTPDQFPDKVLKGSYGKQLGAYGRASQWQQRPAPREGGLFKHQSFRRIKRSELPHMERTCRYWDKAATDEYEREDSAYTAGVHAGWADGNYYVMNVKRERKSPGQVEKLIDDTANSDAKEFGMRMTVSFEREPGASGKHSAEITVARLRGHRVRPDVPQGDKMARAEPYAIAAENGEVFVVEDEWTDKFIDEHLGFPNAKYKDQVDAAAGAYRMLAKPRKGLIDITTVRSVRRAGAVYVPEGVLAAGGAPLSFAQSLCRRFAVIVTGESRSATKQVLQESAGLGNSWSVIQIWDYFPGRKLLFLINSWRHPSEWNTIVGEGLRFIEQNLAKRMVIEDSMFGRNLNKQLRSKNPKLVTPLRITDSAELVPLQNLVISGSMFVPDDEPRWLDDWKVELADWGGDPDDPHGQVACTALACKHGPQIGGAWGGVRPRGSDSPTQSGGIMV